MLRDSQDKPNPVSRPSRWAPAGGLALVVSLAIGAVIAYRSTPAIEQPLVDTGDTLSSVPSNACSRIASQEAAETLLHRLFPKAAFHHFDPFHLASGPGDCLLEVEMSVDPDKPSTRGFVYVLPDGERFLNGPLMDKRSRVSDAPVGSNTLERALEEQRAAIASFVDRTRPANPGPVAKGDTRPTTPAGPDAPTLAPEHFARLTELPQLVSGTKGGTPVYVLLDPKCIHCQRLFAQGDDLAAEHGIEWHWVPMFTTKEGWQKTAAILKATGTSASGGFALLDGAMRKKWKDSEHQELLASLTDNDFELAKNATLLFADIADAAAGPLGTPLVSYRDQSGQVKLIPGVPNTGDWQSLQRDTSPATRP